MGQGRSKAAMPVARAAVSKQVPRQDPPMPHPRPVNDVADRPAPPETRKITMVSQLDILSRTLTRDTQLNESNFKSHATSMRMPHSPLIQVFEISVNLSRDVSSRHIDIKHTDK